MQEGRWIITHPDRGGGAGAGAALNAVRQAALALEGC